ncbi:Sec-independent protein translocase protein TatB [Gallibacterium sp. AGMB14963]|uniref:Sec-independent protein translocase protein TatB n=1 Tax=Gallibacterium faecale TaxID=3019086 RepID=UPI0022F1D02C|nr:Sec-independent protein translocase protein TatB [Gallibacterium sp. AGMB14963]MDA3978163.1 Sec-independent protein translocase protein TatB [Gallibacterium sp. AGMB14963]
MFDIGFSELVLIFVIGLVVLGPQRLPVAIRTVVSWIRTLRNLANNVQSELAQELKLQELQESIKKAEHLNLSSLSPELSKTVEELKASAAKMQQQLDQQTQAANQTVEQLKSSVESGSSASQTANEQSATEVLPDEQAELAEIDEEKLILEQHSDDLATYDPMTSAEQANITNKEKKDS